MFSLWWALNGCAWQQHQPWEVESHHAFALHRYALSHQKVLLRVHWLTWISDQMSNSTECITNLAFPPCTSFCWQAWVKRTTENVIFAAESGYKSNRFGRVQLLRDAFLRLHHQQTLSTGHVLREQLLQAISNLLVHLSAG